MTRERHRAVIAPGKDGRALHQHSQHAMKKLHLLPLSAALAAALATLALPTLAADAAGASQTLQGRPVLDKIHTVVVIYAENRGFDNLYGLFPGANGVPGVNPSARGEAVAQK